jgi:hypothetical protein
MARGWGSKSVEEQQSQIHQPQAKPSKSPDELRRANEVRSVRLKRARVMDQLKNAQNPRYTELLQRELEVLDAELKKLSS